VGEIRLYGSEVGALIGALYHASEVDLYAWTCCCSSECGEIGLLMLYKRQNKYG
jgi:hypothetical protein